MQVTKILPAILVGATMWACGPTKTNNEHSQIDVFSDAPLVVQGIWVGDEMPYRFRVTQTWRGEPVPSGLYDIYFDGNDDPCATSTDLYQPKADQLDGNQLLAVTQIAPTDLDLGSYPAVAAAPVTSEGVVRLRGPNAQGEIRAYAFNRANFSQIDDVARAASDAGHGPSPVMCP